MEIRAGAVLVIGLAAVAAGCTDNAELVLKLDLPPSVEELCRDEMLPRRFARIQVVRATGHQFHEEWAGGDLESVSLDPVGRTDDRMTVISDDETTDLHVKVSFCQDPNCHGLCDPEGPGAWFAIERPFHIGHTTDWAANDFEGRPLIPVIPVPPTDVDCNPDCTEDFDCDPAMTQCDIHFVDACDVHGCIDGTATRPKAYCDEGTGVHACDQ